MSPAVEEVRELPGESPENAEQLEMADNHPKACNFVKDFLGWYPGHRRKRAIDVGCGPGYFTRDVLSKIYNQVDMIDACPEEIFTAWANTDGISTIGTIKEVKMQDFVFPKEYKYNAIYMRWCIGYLSEEEQITWLKKAKMALDNPKGTRYGRKSPPPSFIFVLDNVDERVKRDEAVYRNQKVESRVYYEALWLKAGLIS